MTIRRAPFDSSTRKYAFIDGENLRSDTFDRHYADLADCEDKYVETYVGIVTQLAQRMGTLGPYAAKYARLYRAYYYDAPVGRNHGCYERQKRILDAIGAAAGWHVRPGTLRRRNGRSPRQKEVDVLLAVDMLGHAYRGNMHVALVVSNDLDFRPVIEECGRWGVYVVLGGTERTPQELRECADEFYDISAEVAPPSH